MKLYIKLAILTFGILLSSCEDPISVDLNDAPPRLVIEASLDLQKGTQGNDQTIQLSLSSPFFDNDTDTAVTGASVVVTNTDTNEVFSFADQNDGRYTTSVFNPIINNNYELEVIYNGEVYMASEKLMSVSEIKRVEQSFEGGFDEEVLDVSIFFDDPEDEENYYFVRLDEEDNFPTLEAFKDEFINGNEIDVFFENDEDEDDPNAEFNPGDTVDITLYGISKQYYNYLYLLIEQYDSGGDPFSPTPARIKGNCINVNNSDNYAFGYFRVTEFDTVSYTFE